MPLYLAWVPTVLLLTVAGGLHALDGALGGFAPWSVAAVFLTLLVMSAGLYGKVLDGLAEQVRSCREHLLRM